MLKKRIKKILCFVSAVVIAFSCFNITSSAAQTSSNTYKISMGRPSTGSSTGFAEVLLEDSSGSRYIRVFSWNIYTSTYNDAGNFSYNDYPMHLNVCPDFIQFYFPYSYDFSNKNGNFYLNADVLSFSSSNTSYQFQSFSGANGQWTFSSSAYRLISIHVYGNYTIDYSSLDRSEFYVLYSDEVVMYNQFLQVIQLINQLASDNDTIISKLQSIIDNTDTIESKLQSAINLLTTIETDLDDVNKELDNIESNTDNLESYTDELEEKLDTIIGILNNKNQETPKPDTSTTDDYSAKEQALIGGTSAGREEANTVFTDFNSTMSDNVGRGLLAVSAIMKEFIGVSWLSSLLKFSLALGMFSFILGMGFFVVSRSASHEARSNVKESNHSKNGGKE